MFRLAVSYNLGWRVGWAIAPAFIASAIRNIHVRITDSAPAPFQEAALIALRSPPEYFESLRRVGYSYQSQESFLLFCEIDCYKLNSIELKSQKPSSVFSIQFMDYVFWHAGLRIEKRLYR